MAPSVKLTYFNLRGRGELIRQILAVGYIQYENKFIDFADWPDIKPEMPFSSLPVLCWDGETIGQSITVARFCAKKAGIAGETHMEQAQADMMADHSADLMDKLIAMWPLFCSDEARPGMVSDFMTGFIETWLGNAEKILAGRKAGWFAGNKMSYGDLAMVYQMERFLDPEEPAFKGVAGCQAPVRAAVMAKFPCLSALIKQVNEITAIKEYKANSEYTSM